MNFLPLNVMYRYLYESLSREFLKCHVNNMFLLLSSLLYGKENDNKKVRLDLYNFLL